jgi:hypothetical protein
MWSEQMELFLGEWEGPFQTREAVWLRFFDRAGNLALVESEQVRLDVNVEKQRVKVEKQRVKVEKQRVKVEKQRADGEKQRADGEKQRADTAEADLAALRARLAQLEATLSSSAGRPEEE